MLNYPDKLKIVNLNSLEVTCKDKRAIFTCCINFARPLVDVIMSSTTDSSRSSFECQIVIIFYLYHFTDIGII